MNIIERIEELRKLMSENNISAYIIPSSDPHQSEYVAPCWEARKWISGFTGSAGTVVIAKDKAGLWTDSRYFVQAKLELENTGIELFKMGFEDTPSFDEWILDELNENDIVGFDGKVFPVSYAKMLETKLKIKKINIESKFDLVAKIWQDRPDLPKTNLFTHDIEYTGESRLDKIERIRQEMHKKGVNFHLISALDDIAWILNIRSEDILYNPVVISYLLISQDKVYFFINREKISLENFKELQDDEINIYPYNEVNSYLKELDIDKVLIDPSKTNKSLYDVLNAKENCLIKEGKNISTFFKSVKNETEIAREKEALIYDGAAMVNWLYWLKSNIGKEKMTEISIADKLEAFRSEQKDFMGLSFNTIAGYNEHGAIIHYSATKESEFELKKEGSILVDSGAQFLGGTTDITRTIALGPVSDEVKTDFTLVLKGHIDLANCKFPKGTKGCNIDILARKALWDNGLNFFHGTGHGVGAFLNVHEGPQGISQALIPQDIKAGMLTSNEPGLYKEGKHGIRIESLILAVHDKATDFGEFLKFETITMCPIDKELIKVELLSKEQIKWLNDYHKTVFEKVSPLVSDEVKSWLAEATKEI